MRVLWQAKTHSHSSYIVQYIIYIQGISAFETSRIVVSEWPSDRVHRPGLLPQSDAKKKYIVLRFDGASSLISDIDIPRFTLLSQMGVRVIPLT